MPRHAVNIEKVQGSKRFLRERIARGQLSSTTQRQYAEFLSFLTKATPHLKTYNSDFENSYNETQLATQKIFSSARKAVKLSKRRTFRKGDFNAQLGRVNEGLDLLYQERSGGVLLLTFCGITDEMVRWATGQSPPTCLLCREEGRDYCEVCISWPQGSPFDTNFNPEEHWILATPTRSELDPYHYPQMEQQLGLLRLFEALLAPSAEMLSKPKKRLPNVRVQDLMFELFEIFNLVYGVEVYYKNEKAMVFSNTFCLGLVLSTLSQIIGCVVLRTRRSGTATNLRKH